jgi:acyl-CoA reductase-like NAD-dependent aldehyde dehydrogenase
MLIIVTPDADDKMTGYWCCFGKRTAGQRCTSTSRITFTKVFTIK